MNAKNEYMIPATDIFETGDFYALKVEMPGVSKENLEVFIENDELEIRGKVNEESAKEYGKESGFELKYHEFQSNDFYRKFRVGKGVDKNSIDAKLENGVLSLNLKKKEDAKPKRIEVKVKH